MAVEPVRVGGGSCPEHSASIWERPTRPGRCRSERHHRFDVDGGLFAPEEISAQVLRKLGEDAARYLGEKVTDAVITVPAGFGHAQREATWGAGALAGLNVLHLLEEPAATARARETNLTRPRFDALTPDLVEKCIPPFRQALAGARLSGHEIDEVVDAEYTRP